MTTTLPALLGGPPAVEGSPPIAWPIISDDVVRAVMDQLRSGEISIYGRTGVLGALEDDFASFHGRRYAVSFNSGTSALAAAYYAVGLMPGDEVIAPSYTFWATVTPMLRVGAVPVFAEIDPCTLTLDPADVERRIGPRTRAIAVNHNWGATAELDQLSAIADRHGLALIEDCSHAHGARYRGARVGTRGRVSCFSMQAQKPVVAGEGGMLLTDDNDCYERAVLFGHYGERSTQGITSERYRRFAEAGIGQKLRIHPLAAAIAREYMRHLDEWNQVRSDNMQRLSERLERMSAFDVPAAASGGQHIYYRYKLQYHAERTELPTEMLVAALRAEGVPIKRADEPLLHLLPVFQGGDDRAVIGAPFDDPEYRSRVSYGSGDLPVTERTFSRILTIPPLVRPAAEFAAQYAHAFEKVIAHADELRRSSPPAMITS